MLFLLKGALTVNNSNTLRLGWLHSDGTLAVDTNWPTQPIKDQVDVMVYSYLGSEEAAAKAAESIKEMLAPHTVGCVHIVRFLTPLASAQALADLLTADGYPAEVVRIGGLHRT